MNNSAKIWRQVHGVITPGGDPFWECPVCGKSGHLYGIECLKNHTNICKNCGTYLIYPWEREDNEENNKKNNEENSNGN